MIVVVPRSRNKRQFVLSAEITDLYDKGKLGYGLFDDKYMNQLDIFADVCKKLNDRETQKVKKVLYLCDSAPTSRVTKIQEAVENVAGDDAAVFMFKKPKAPKKRTKSSRNFFNDGTQTRKTTTPKKPGPNTGASSSSTAYATGRSQEIETVNVDKQTEADVDALMGFDETDDRKESLFLLKGNTTSDTSKESTLSHTNSDKVSREDKENKAKLNIRILEYRDLSKGETLEEVKEWLIPNYPGSLETGVESTLVWAADQHKANNSLPDESVAGINSF